MRLAVAGVCLAVAPVILAQDKRTELHPFPTDAEIHRMLVERVDVKRQTMGMVVGIVTPAERRVVAYGHFAQDDPRLVDGDTIFEIGSVTKVFTALLLAEMEQRGEVGIDDAVSRYLPAGAKVHSTHGREMTLTDLATHTSGLPFWPSNIPPDVNGARMMADYTVAQLYQFVAGFEVPAEVGSRWAYSNIDAGLLGLALGHRARADYETLLRQRITGPLGMTSTAATLSPELQARRAIGHDKALERAPRWDVPALVGAGSLHSTANDLLTFLAAAMGEVSSPLAPAFRSMLQTRREGPGFEQALGWWIFTDAEKNQLATHVGGTLGFSSQLSYDPKRRIGIVVLSNSVNAVADVTTQLLKR